MSSTHPCHIIVTMINLINITPKKTVYSLQDVSFVTVRPVSLPNQLMIMY